MMIYSQLAIVSLVFLVLWFPFQLICHLSETGYNPLVNAVSDYGSHPKTRKFALLAWWTTALGAAFLTAAAAELFESANINATSGIALLGVFAGARLLTSCFKNLVRHNPPPNQDPDDQTAQNNTMLHVVFAILSFASICAAEILLSKASMGTQLAETPVGMNSEGLYGLAIATCVAIIVMAFTRRAGVFGIGERIFYGFFFAWLLMFASLIIMTN